MRSRTPRASLFHRPFESLVNLLRSKSLQLSAFPLRVTRRRSVLLPPIADIAAIAAAFAQLRAQHVLAQLECLASMRARKLLGAVGVARHDSLKEVAMLLQRLGRSARDIKRGSPHLPDMVEQAFQRLQQAIVMRGAADQSVKLRGQGPQRRDIA